MNGDVTVREAMTRDFVGVSEGDDIVDAASLLVEEDTAGAVVLRGQKPIGMLTSKDALAWLTANGESQNGTVADGMREGAPTVAPDRRIEDAAALLFTHSTSQLVVVEDDEPLGILTEKDIVATTTLAPAETAGEQTVEPARVEAELGAAAEGDGGFTEQGICERCGSLTGDLTSFNGQLLCADCQEV